MLDTLTSEVSYKPLRFELRQARHGKKELPIEIRKSHAGKAARKLRPDRFYIFGGDCHQDLKDYLMGGTAPAILA